MLQWTIHGLDRYERSANAEELSEPNQVYWCPLCVNVTVSNTQTTSSLGTVHDCMLRVKTSSSREPRSHRALGVVAIVA